MDNIFETKIERCYVVKFARSAALRKCVMDTSSLRKEFFKTVDHKDSTEEFSNKLSNFISTKGLRILSEKPVARIIDGRYVVDVYFKVTW